MESHSLNPDLDDSACSVAGCFSVADVVGSTRVVLPPLVGAPEPDLVLELPLCIEHAHLLRMGVTGFDLDSGI